MAMSLKTQNENENFALFREDAWQDPEAFRTRCRSAGLIVVRDENLMFAMLCGLLTSKGISPADLTTSDLHGTLRALGFAQVGPFWLSIEELDALVFNIPGDDDSGD